MLGTLRWLAAAIVCVASPGAWGQRLLDEAGPLVTPITARTVEELSRALELDRDQRELARSLYQGYRAALKQSDADAQARLEAVTGPPRHDQAIAVHEPEQHRKIQRVRMEQLQAVIDQADALEASYFDDLGALLTDAQAAKLPAAKRSRSRETGARFALVAGEGVDLVRVLDELKIDRAGGAVGEAVAQYEADAEKLFDGKKAMFRRVFRRMSEAEARDEDPDPKMMNDVVTEIFDHGTRLRDVNRRSARRIAGELPDSRRAEFEREVQKRSFPKVYAPSAASRALEAVAGFDDLTADQKTQLAEIRASFDREAGPLNDRWAAALEAAQTQIPGRFMEILASGGDVPGTEPLKEACRARAALDERIRGRLHSLLTEPQRRRMEELKIEPTDFEPDFMPDFDEGDVWDEWEKEDGEQGGG